MVKMNYKQKQQYWFKRYILSIHLHDQMQAKADELEAVGNIQFKYIKSKQKMHEFVMNIAKSRLDELKDYYET